jgi:hypothetical protein
MKTNGGVDPRFLGLGGEWSASRSCRFTFGTHWIGGWAGSRDGLDDMQFENS